MNEDDFIELYRNFSDEQRTELHKFRNILFKIYHDNRKIFKN